MKSIAIRPSYKQFPTQRAKIHIWNSGRHKEHLYTFELPPKRNPIRFSSFLQDSIGVHPPCPLPNFTLIYHHSSELQAISNSKSTYIPLSCHQNATCLRFSSYSQGSITTHSPCFLPNFIQIQWHPLKLLSDSNSKSTYIPLSCHQNAIPSDWTHIHRAASQHTRHALNQIWMKSNAIHPSYTRFYAHPKNMNFLTPSDWAHFHRVAPAHTRHALHKISSKSNAIRRSYTRLRLKEHLYTFESAKFQISLIFTGQHRGTPPMPAHQVPSKSNAVRPSYSRFFKWKGECTPLATEKGGWRMRVTVSHLKIATNTHFSRFSHLHRVLERCDLVRPLGHVSPHMCSLHASLVRRSPAELHAILCVGGGTFHSQWTPCGAPPAAVLAAAIFWIFVWCTR